MGLLGMLLIAVMVGFFVMSAVKMAPGYIDYLAMRDIAIRVAEEYDKDRDTFATLRRKFADFMNTNQIYAIQPNDIKFKREKGDVIIDAGYEQRIPLFWRVDIVVRYDDLVFIAGEKYSD
jgi:phage FluMu gp28-like protein